MTLLLFGSFIFFVLIRVPVVFSLALSCLTVLLWNGDISLMLLAQRTATSLDSFPLLAVPLFIMMGEIMNRGGCGEKLVEFSQRLVGGITGGLAHANIVASMFFGGISGVATADTAAIGSVLIPTMLKAGYDAKFSTVVTVTSSIIGIIIPPSIDMILYGWISGTSIVELFAGGIIPGILVGLSLMALSHWICMKRGYRSDEKFSFPKLSKAFVSALPALVMPILIIGGMFTGIFTATEAASIAVVYGIIIAVVFYKGLQMKDIPDLILQVCTTVGSIMLLIAVCKTFGWKLTAERIPHTISEFFLNNLPYKSLFLLNVILICLVVGTFLTPAAATIILTPILAPVSTSFGIDPVHFGLVVVCSVAIGHVTPPVALTLYIGAGISGVPVSDLIKPLMPFLLVLILVTLAVAYIPPLTLFLPSLMR
ncbi:MAG: TRAP transporter large permease [Desulfobacterales bacterium]|nr:TRAP transporter large permease [Desulfobacterales bacterium]